MLDEDEKEPAGHCRQFTAPEVEDVPSGHGRHVSDPASVAYVPGAQGVLIPSVHVCPGGHGVHAIVVPTSE